jgi:hypothetical protein
MMRRHARLQEFVSVWVRLPSLILLNFVNYPQRVNMHRVSSRNEVDLQHVRLLVGPTAPSAEYS